MQRRGLKESYSHPAIAVSCGKTQHYSSVLTCCNVFNSVGTCCVSTVGAPALEYYSSIMIVSEAYLLVAYDEI